MQLNERPTVAAYKFVQVTHTIADAVSGAYGDLQNLRDEMRDWADNLEDGNLGHTEKFDRVSECADAFDPADNEPEIPACLEGVNVVYGEAVSTRKGRSASRSTRCSNAVGALEAVKDAAEAKQEEVRQRGADGEATEAKTEETVDELQAFLDELDEMIDAGQSAEFPGMYG